MRRVAAMSSKVSDVCTRYSKSLLNRRLRTSYAKVRSNVRVDTLDQETCRPKKPVPHTYG